MKNLRYILFVLAVVAVISCNKEDDKELPIKENINIEIEERQTYLTEFQPINACEASSINVFIDDCFNETGYATGIPAALEVFNEAPTSLNFIIVENSDEADIVFSCEDGGICGEAIASFPLEGIEEIDGFEDNVVTTFPSGGTLGGSIILNTNWEGCPCGVLDECFFMHTAIHELFHTLGFIHNDQQGITFPAPFGTALVPGTSAAPYEIGSVINSGPSEVAARNWCNASCEFSENDLLALQFLYPEVECPCPPQFPDIPLSICVGSQFNNIFLPGFNNVAVNVLQNAGNDIHFEPELPLVWSNITSPGLIIIEITWEFCGEIQTKTVFVYAINC